MATWTIVRFVPKLEIAPTFMKLPLSLQKFERISFDIANKDAHDCGTSFFLIIIIILEGGIVQ